MSDPIAPKDNQALRACTDPCPIERGMRILGGKWKASILWQLRDQPVRFNQLARLIPGASKKMLVQRLQELEQLGMVDRLVISERPMAVSYQCTDFGRSALAILSQLKDWIEQHEL